jgi:FkbM family methyltransferase
VLSAVRTIIGLVPVSFGVGGRADALSLKVLDGFFSRTTFAHVRTELGMIQLSMRHEPQRLMAYCYHNLRRHYVHSPLGRYIDQLDPTGTFVDVGANLGFYSLLAREAGLRAICFEPEPQFVDYLSRNRGIFGDVFGIALSNEEGALPLYHYPGNWGASSLVPVPGCTRAAATVPVKTFSSAAAEGHLGDPDRISLVKIDVEGAEAATVAGMTKFLSSGHRPDIWCEVRGNRTDRAQGSFARVRSLLKPFGYSALDVTEETAGKAAPADAVLRSRGVFDLLFRAKRERADV